MNEDHKQCPKCGRVFTSIRAASHLSTHLKKCIGVQVSTAPTQKPAFRRASLFSVIQGDVHLRGCEFNGGFLVLNKDTIQVYPTLAQAITDAEQLNAEAVLFQESEAMEAE